MAGKSPAMTPEKWFNMTGTRSKFLFFELRIVQRFKNADHRELLPEAGIMSIALSSSPSNAPLALISGTLN